jgi:hypothetical protein
MNRFNVVFIALVALLVANPAAHAQAPGPSKGSTPMGGHLKPPSQDPAKSADLPVSLTGQAQLVLDKMEDELRIGAHQQMAWDAYSKKVLRYAEDLARARYAARDMQDGGTTAPQQFERLTEIANNRMTAVEEIVESGRALYATLGADQRPIADKVLVLLPLRLVSRSLVGTGPGGDDGAPSAARRR